MAILIRLVAILSTAAIPVLLGFRASAENQNVFANAALVMGAVATFLNAWEMFYGYKELWGVNTATATQLRSLALDLGYLTSGGQDAVADDVLDELHRRLQQTLTEANSAWVGVRQSTARQSPPQPIIPRKDQ